MYRFFVPVENVDESGIIITGDDINHIKNVLRMQCGDKVVVSCGRGVDYFCVIKEFREDSIVLECEEQRPAVTELPVKITLFQSLPKKDKMELIIQKAVELGVFEVVPVKSRRCVVRLDEKKAQKKRERWCGIAESAAKQSGRGFIPEIKEVMPFEQALRYAGTMDVVMIPYELCEDMMGTVSIMRRAIGEKSIGIFIGPEGGFERSEVELAIQGGAVPISLGRRILRTETAGMTVLSVLMFLTEAGCAAEREGEDGMLLG